MATARQRWIDTMSGLRGDIRASRKQRATVVLDNGREVCNQKEDVGEHVASTWFLQHGQATRGKLPFPYKLARKYGWSRMHKADGGSHGSATTGKPTPEFDTIAAPQAGDHSILVDAREALGTVAADALASGSTISDAAALQGISNALLHYRLGKLRTALTQGTDVKVLSARVAKLDDVPRTCPPRTIPTRRTPAAKPAGVSAPLYRMVPVPVSMGYVAYLQRVGCTPHSTALTHVGDVVGGSMVTACRLSRRSRDDGQAMARSLAVGIPLGSALLQDVLHADARYGRLYGTP